MIDEKEQQSKTENQNADEKQANRDRDAVALLAPSANDRCAMRMGFGPPPSFASRPVSVQMPKPPSMPGQLDNRMAAPVYGLPVRWAQPPRSVVPSEQQSLPQDSESMGFIYGPATVMNDVNRAARIDQNVNTHPQTTIISSESDSSEKDEPNQP